VNPKGRKIKLTELL